MNLTELKIADCLKDLKENYCVIGLKAEFETEGAQIEEAFKLKGLADDNDLDFVIKVGGCGAIKDMFDAKAIGVSAIVAPMIETTYALQKFITSVNTVFTEQEDAHTKLYINIETKCGFDLLKEILASQYASKIAGIVFGRTDMALSLGMNLDDIDNRILCDYANNIASLSEQYNKELIIGGGISLSSLPFLQKINNLSFKKFETRKVIFDAKEFLRSKYKSEGIIKALEFERLCIENRQNIYGTLNTQDIKRIKELELRANNIKLLS